MATRNAEIPPTTQEPIAPVGAVPPAVPAVLTAVPAARPAWAIEADELFERRSKAAKSDFVRLVEPWVVWLLSKQAVAVILLSAAAGLAAGRILSSGASEQGVASQPAREAPRSVEDGGQPVAGGSSGMEFAAPRDPGPAVAATTAAAAGTAGSGDQSEAIQRVDGGAQLGRGAAAAPGIEPARPSVPEVAVPLRPTVSTMTLEAEPTANLPLPVIMPTENPPSEGPSQTAVDTPPTLLNTSRIQALIPQQHPRILKDVGLGGSVEMWLYVDESGAVARHEVRTSSGNDLLDAAAGRIVSQMRFSPAMNRDQATPVWVRQVLTFPSEP